MNPLEVFTEQSLDFYKLLMALTIMQRSYEESDLKSHRLKNAWATKRKEGAAKKLTRRCPSWLRLTDDRSKFEVIEERATIVRRIFSDAAAGIGTFTIVRRLNEAGVPPFMGSKLGWQNSTVNKILGGTAAMGTFQPNKMENGKRRPEGDPIKDYFPRIVSDRVFESAQRGRLDRSTKPRDGRKGSGGIRGQHLNNLFGRLAVCSYCNSSMYYQNKGKSPKGGTYLVCSKSTLHSGCEMKRRWRYEHFETTFLLFVKQLDLASLVSSTEHTETKRDLASRLDAAEGKIKILEEERRRAFKLGMRMAEFDNDFIFSQMKKIEAELAEAKSQDKQLRHEISILDQTELTYYQRPDEVAELIERVRSSRGGDVYKVRAQIASRLQSLIKELRLTIDPNDQNFEVVFRDGNGMMLFVDPENPAKFTQKVSGKEPIFEMVQRDGAVMLLPAEEDAADGI